MMAIPFAGLDRQYRQYRDDYLAITDRVYSTGRALQGPENKALEEQLCALCGRKFAVAVGSATDALAFALLAAGIKPGDEVLVTAFSFFASVSPILRVGAIPRFVDIEDQYYMMNPDLLDGMVSKKTRALMAVHLLGQTLPMEVIEAFATRHRLAIIEDAAQAIGSRDGDRPAGSLGRVSCLSFDPTKVIGSFSSAGALLTDDEEIAAHARALRYHGRSPKTQRYEILGYNSQLCESMAGMLSFKLKHLDEWLSKRDSVAEVYRKRLCGLEDLSLPARRPGSSHNWHKFVIRTPRRDLLAQHLKSRGIETMVHYPRPLCDEPLLASSDLRAEDCRVPVARKAAGEVLSLPIYPELTGTEAEQVAAEVKNFFQPKGA